MPKNVKKPNPYPAKARPQEIQARKPAPPLPAPLRKLVQGALEGLKQPNAIPSVVIQSAVERAYAFGAASKNSK